MEDVLDLSELVEGAGPGEVIYDLVGIMFHKGGSASHGHYVAEVKDTETGK